MGLNSQHSTLDKMWSSIQYPFFYNKDLLESPWQVDFLRMLVEEFSFSLLFLQPKRCPISRLNENVIGKCFYDKKELLFGLLFAINNGTLTPLDKLIFLKWLLQSCFSPCHEGIQICVQFHDCMEMLRQSVLQCKNCLL